MAYRKKEKDALVMGLTVSVITATYNDADHLEQIIEQVKKQDYADLEYIVVDGASTDRTPQVLARAKEWFGERMKVCSEPDRGIYDAINKGIRMASGDVIGCCFDEYSRPDAVSRLVGAIKAEQADGVHADLDYCRDGRVVRKWRQGQGNLRFGWMPGHPTFYVRREVYERYGLYRTDYRISADYEFMVRCLKDGQVRLAYVPEVLIRMSYGGTSSNGLSAYLLSLREGHRALRENKVRFAWFTDVCRTLKVLRQFV